MGREGARRRWGGKGRGKGGGEEREGKGGGVDCTRELNL